MSTLSLEEERALLEQQADLSRARLLGLLEALDHKREEVMSPTYQVRRQVEKHPEALAVVGGSMVLAVGGIVAMSVYFERRRQERLFWERIRAVGRFWEHPEWFAPRKPRPGVFAQISRKLVVAVATVAVVEPVRRLLKMAIGKGFERAVQRVQFGILALAERPRLVQVPVAPKALSEPPVRVDFGAPVEQSSLVHG